MNPSMNITERTNVLINEFEKLSQLEKHQKLKLVADADSTKSPGINGRHFEFLSGRSRGLFTRISHAFSKLNARREGQLHELESIKTRVSDLLDESRKILDEKNLSDGDRTALSIALQKAKKGAEILERKNDNKALTTAIDELLNENSEKIKESTYKTLSSDNRSNRIKIQNNSDLTGKLLGVIAHNKFIEFEVREKAPKDEQNVPEDKQNNKNINSLETIIKTKEGVNQTLKNEIYHLLKQNNPNTDTDVLKNKRDEIIEKILYYSSQHPLAKEHAEIKNAFIKKENGNITLEKIEIKNGLCTCDLKLEKGKIILERHDIMDVKGEDLVDDGKGAFVFQTIKSIDVKYSVDLTNNEKVTTSYKSISKRARKAFEAKVKRRNTEYSQQTGQVE